MESTLLTRSQRPDIRPPLFCVRMHDDEAVQPGYWFVTPVATMIQPAVLEQYEPHQVGPHIYDSNGDLIWSGASFVENRNAFDFRVVDVRGIPHLSFIVSAIPHDKEGKKGVARGWCDHEQRV